MTLAASVEGEIYDCQLHSPLSRAPATACVLFAGCGGGGGGNVSTHSKKNAPGTSVTQAAAGAPSEAQSAATGDIPDNQVFLTFNNHVEGYRSDTRKDGRERARLATSR